MAKDILYMDNGVTVNAGWTDHIVISNDGVNWDLIPKVGVIVGHYPIHLNTSVPNSYPERNKEEGWVVVLKHNDIDGPLLKFNPSKVTNQPGWVAGTPQANALAAVADIATWLAS